MNPGAINKKCEPSTRIDIAPNRDCAEQSIQSACMHLAIGSWCGATERGHALAACHRYQICGAGAAQRLS